LVHSSASGSLRESGFVPKAEVHVLDAGDFALHTASDQISQLVRDFMK
jgi:hypothetical protein